MNNLRERERDSGEIWKGERNVEERERYVYGREKRIRGRYSDEKRVIKIVNI